MTSVEASGVQINAAKITLAQTRTKPTKKSDNDWTNSAQTRTQEEIEAHYTLANFPPVKYYSQNGGGSGAYSPYPQKDPRAAAYAIR